MSMFHLFGGGSFGGLGGGIVENLVAGGSKEVLKPEREERRREADRCNAEALDALDEAEELRSDELSSLQSRAEDLNRNLHQQAETLSDLKIRIGRSIQQEVTPHIERFQAFDIQHLVGRAPDLESSTTSSLLPAIAFGALSKSVAGGFGGFGGGLSLLNLLHDDTQEYLDIAQENRYKAREYLANVCKAVAEAKMQVNAMAATLASMQSEEQTLRELYRRLQRHMAALSHVQLQKSFTKEEAAAWQNICNIAVLIRDSLRVQICKSDGSMAAGYDRYLAQLNHIAATVPEQPTLQHRSFLLTPPFFRD